MTHQQKSARIPNSNPWLRPDQKTFFQLDDLAPEVAKQYKQLQRGKGANTPDLMLTIDLILKRREVDAKTVEKSSKYNFDRFYDTDELLGLSYQELQTYTSQLSDKDITRLYGAERKSVKSVKEFLRNSGARIVRSNAREQRTLTFEIASDKFLEAFTDGKLEYNFSLTSPQYISSKGTSKSFLRAQGEGAKQFANSILGINIVKDRSTKPSADEQNAAGDEEATAVINLLPSQIAEIYHFPGTSDEISGTGARIGLVGSGGNKAMLNWHGSENYNQYLRRQQRDPSKAPRPISLNPEYQDRDETSEQMLDTSILTSLAPGAQILASASEQLYDNYAQLIYLEEPVDVISSSSSLDVFNNYLAKAFDELFIDAMLRRITTVVASGDAGTLNLRESALRSLVPGKSFSKDKANLSSFASGAAASLSVGGTALGHFIDDTGKTHLTPQGQTTWNERQASSPYNTYQPIFMNGFSEAQLNLPGMTLFDANAGFIQGIGASGNFKKSSGLHGARYQRDNLTGEWQKNWRSYPDISMMAGGNLSNGARFYYAASALDSVTGQYKLQGDNEGTSAAAPLTAALLAIAASELKKEYGEDAKIGFINPLLYELYNSDARTEVFYDVPAGSNNANIYYYPQKPEEWDGLYMSYVINEDDSTVTYIPLNGTGPNGELDLNYSSTGPGFDAPTGLGSLNGQGFLNQLLAAYATL